MSETTSTPGRVVWRELMTHDVAVAKRFYGELLGWRFQEHDMGPASPPYTVADAAGKSVAGIMEIPAGGRDAQPFWLSYVSVLDVDGACAKAEARGGEVVMGPVDIPEVGRIATIKDFAGALIGLIRSTTSDPALGVPALGQFCWETLASTDPVEAKAFYADVIGWVAQETPAGSLLAVGQGPTDGVADLQKTQGDTPAAWTTYVVVDALESARARVEKLGGEIGIPLIELANVGRVAFVSDPGGAQLGLFQPAIR